MMMSALRIILQRADNAGGVLATWLWTALARVRIRLRGGTVGRNFRVRGWLQLHVHRSGVLAIGDNVRMNSGFANNAVGGFRRTGIWVGPCGMLTIGEGAGLSNCTLVCMERVTIGPRTLVGGDTNIYDTDFHPVCAAERNASPPGRTKTRPVTIGRDCFIGGHAIILKGVSMGDGAVLGAGSVAVRDIPAREVWAGNPARLVRRLAPPVYAAPPAPHLVS